MHTKHAKLTAELHPSPSPQFKQSTHCFEMGSRSALQADLELLGSSTPLSQPPQQLGPQLHVTGLAQGSC
jgi:hypothetical protein